MKNLNWVPNDGYTDKGFVKAEAGLHGEFRFTYRPFLVEERGKLLRQVESMPQEKQDAKGATELKERLVSWSLVNGKAAAVPISLDVIRRLKPALFYKLYSIVLGTMASDLDPEWEEATLLENIDAEIDAGPAPIGTVKEANAEKNSD